MGKPLLVGEAPSTVDGRLPLGGRVGARLCDSLGWAFDDDPYYRLARDFDLHNIFDTPQDDWDRYAAIANWKAFLLRRMSERAIPRVIICLGHRPALAMGAGDRPYYRWDMGQLYQSVVVPHPSGRNRVWNDPATPPAVRDALLEGLRRAAE